MLTVTRRPLTYHDYRELPEHGPRYQLIEGDLHMAPAPNRFHQDISKNLQFIFMKYLEEHPIGTVYDAPFDVQLTDINVYQPDIVLVLEPNRSVLTDQGAEGAPDLVVEILSPKTARFDVGVKREVYARTGVQELWIIDPDRRNLQRFRLQENAETPVETKSAQDTLTTPLLPGLVVELDRVFHLY